MGNSNSVHVFDKDNIYDNVVAGSSVSKTTESTFFMQSKTPRTQIPLQVITAHFTPSSFPMIPVVSKSASALCAESWERIVTDDRTNRKDGGRMTISGMTAFYNEVSNSSS
jgi:hypothetical protein